MYIGIAARFVLQLLVANALTQFNWNSNGCFKAIHVSMNGQSGCRTGQVLFSEIPHMHWKPCEKDKDPAA